jgi:hypothetical protein
LYIQMEDHGILPEACNSSGLKHILHSFIHHLKRMLLKELWSASKIVEQKRF